MNLDGLPFEVVNPLATSALVIHCDHGGHAVPVDLGNLGLADEVFGKHVALDIGAVAVARGLSERLGATALLARYSRLVIDANRAWGDPDAVPAVSDGLPIPKNQNLGIDDILERAAAIVLPYHHAIDAAIARVMRRGQIPVILSVHSFTPALVNRSLAKPRPWHVGVMFSRDERLSRALSSGLLTRPGLIVGENQPYSGITHGYCLKLHGLAQGLPHAQIEIRQDLICTEEGQRWWSDLLAAVVEPILDHDDLKEVMHL